MAPPGESFVIVDPGLRLDQLEEIQREVADSLRGGAEEVPGAADVGGRRENESLGTASPGWA